MGVAAIDLGIKASTPRGSRARACEVHVLPATATADDLLAVAPDGVFFSNGPGDPAAADYAVAAVRGVLGRVPVFGICFGNQVLGRALGLGTYKLKYGHRGVNQPVQDRATGRVHITSHNHGFAVDAPLDAAVDTPYGRAGSATSTSTTTWSRAASAGTCRRSPCSTTPRPPPARTTRPASSTGSPS